MPAYIKKRTLVLRGCSEHTCAIMKRKTPAAQFWFQSSLY